MINEEMLEKKIAEIGMSPTVLAAALGVSVPTYYSRKKGKSEFTASEITKACKALNLTRKERDAIFFGE